MSKQTVFMIWHDSTTMVVWLDNPQGRQMAEFTAMVEREARQDMLAKTCAHARTLGEEGNKGANWMKVLPVTPFFAAMPSHSLIGFGSSEDWSEDTPCATPQMVNASMAALEWDLSVSVKPQ